MAFQTTHKYFLVSSPAPYVAHVEINRPAKLNAWFEAMWLEFKVVFDTLSLDPDVRAIILSGAGDRAFTAGLDVEAAAQSGILAQATRKTQDVARIAVGIKRHVVEFQDCISSVEKCEKRRPPATSPQSSLLRSRGQTIGMFIGLMDIFGSGHLCDAWICLWSCS